jgi:hypothetical protein
MEVMHIFEPKEQDEAFRYRVEYSIEGEMPDWDANIAALWWSQLSPSLGILDYFGEWGWEFVQFTEGGDESTHYWRRYIMKAQMDEYGEAILA